MFGLSCLDIIGHKRYFKTLSYNVTDLIISESKEKKEEESKDHGEAKASIGMNWEGQTVW